MDEDKPIDAGKSEDDVSRPSDMSTERFIGGDPKQTDGDSATTTGPGENEVFVGRVAGQDQGYAGETGAERREAADGGEPDLGAATEGLTHRS